MQVNSEVLKGILSKCLPILPKTPISPIMEGVAFLFEKKKLTARATSFNVTINIEVEGSFDKTGFFLPVKNAEYIMSLPDQPLEIKVSDVAKGIQVVVKHSKGKVSFTSDLIVNLDRLVSMPTDMKDVVTMDGIDLMDAIKMTRPFSESKESDVMKAFNCCFLSIGKETVMYSSNGNEVSSSFKMNHSSGNSMVGIPNHCTSIMASLLPDNDDVTIMSAHNSVCFRWNSITVSASEYTGTFPIEVVKRIMNNDRPTVCTFVAEEMLSAVKRMAKVVDVDDLNGKKVLVVEKQGDVMVISDKKGSCKEEVSCSGGISRFKMASNLFISALSKMNGDVTMNTSAGLTAEEKSKADGLKLSNNGFEVVIAEII